MRKPGAVQNGAVGVCVTVVDKPVEKIVDGVRIERRTFRSTAAKAARIVLDSP